MIHRAHRFHRRSSLRYVFDRGRIVRDAHLALRSAPNPRYDGYRMAVVVSRKVSKSAVVRNRIRRRIYEIVRRLDPPISQPYDLVFTVYNSELATMSGEELSKVITTILARAHVTDTRPAMREQWHAIVKAKENGD